MRLGNSNGIRGDAMTLEITINLDNAAFTESVTDEVTAVLKRMVDKLDRITCGECVRLFDSNGNCVGSAQIGDGE